MVEIATLSVALCGFPIIFRGNRHGWDRRDDVLSGLVLRRWEDEGGCWFVIIEPSHTVEATWPRNQARRCARGR